MVQNGFKSFIGLAEEVGFGIQLAPTDFIEFNSEGLQKEINRIMSGGIRNSASAVRFKNGATGVGGDIEAEIFYAGLELFIKNAMGNVVTTNPGTLAYLHTFDLTDALANSLSIDVNRGGTPFRYSGCKVNTMGLTAELDAILMSTFGILGQEEYVAGAISPASPGSPTYLDSELAVFTEGLIEIDDVETEILTFSLTLNNNLKDDKRKIGQASRIAIPRNDLREVTGILHVEFDDLTQYTRFINGTEAKLYLKFTGSNIELDYDNQIEITCPRIIYNGETPVVGGREILEHDIPFTTLYDLTGASDEMVMAIQNERASV